MNDQIVTNATNTNSLTAYLQTLSKLCPAENYWQMIFQPKLYFCGWLKHARIHKRILLSSLFSNNYNTHTDTHPFNAGLKNWLLLNLKKNFAFLIFTIGLCVYVCTCTCECGCPWEPEVSGPQELELKMVVSQLTTWKSGTKPGSSGTAVSVFNHWALSPAP